MRTLFAFTIITLCIACTNKQINKVEQEDQPAQPQIQVPEFQSIIDSANLNGSVLIYDLKEDKFYSNDFEWANKGRLPASTFKIVNSIIALETGVVLDDSTLFPWNGEQRRMRIWEKDMTFKQAFHNSCIPCYQEVARKIGVEQMQEHLKKFNYGNMQLDSASIDLFWLEGESTISQFEQIQFLKSFYLSELDISQRTKDIMSEMMVIDKNQEYKLSGKTGWSIRNGHNNGWFVGYVEYESKVYFFATNVSPEEQFNMKMFPIIRKNVTFNALDYLTSDSSSNNL